jgi:hypothetical protein
MDEEKLFEKLSVLQLGQQRMEDKLDAHLKEHKVSFDRITKLYIPLFGVLLPVASFLMSWLHANIVFAKTILPH